MSREFRQQICENAARLRETHGRVHETLASRGQSPAHRQIWSDACAAFHASYDALAFPGGYAGASERVRSGDARAVEAALAFSELRPYFFRFGYMFKALLRCAEAAPLTGEQAARLRIVVQRRAEWRGRKNDLARTAVFHAKSGSSS